MAQKGSGSPVRVYGKGRWGRSRIEVSREGIRDVPTFGRSRCYPWNHIRGFVQSYEILPRVGEVRIIAMLTNDGKDIHLRGVRRAGRGAEAVVDGIVKDLEKELYGGPGGHR